MFKKYINRLIKEQLDQPVLHKRHWAEECVVEETEEDDETISFSLTPAIGGRILRTTRRNKHGNREHQVYVIPSGEDVGERVAKILNLELLK